MRPDVNAIVHNHSHAVVPFSCTGVALLPIYHMAAFIGLGVPSWDIRDAQKGTDMLVKTPFLGEHLARGLGKYPAVLMRGHGSTVVAENIQRAVGRTIYLELNARMQYQAIMLAGSVAPCRVKRKPCLTRIPLSCRLPSSTVTALVSERPPPSVATTLMLYEFFAS